MSIENSDVDAALVDLQEEIDTLCPSLDQEIEFAHPFKMWWRIRATARRKKQRKDNDDPRGEEFLVDIGKSSLQWSDGPIFHSNSIGTQDRQKVREFLNEKFATQGLQVNNIKISWAIMRDGEGGAFKKLQAHFFAK